MMSFRALVLTAGLFLAGCVSQYSITESEVENYLSNELSFEVVEGNQLFGLELKLNDIEVKLGEKPETISVATLSLFKVKNPLMPLTAELNITFEAKPWYDAKSHSIYLRGLNLVRLDSKPEELEQALSQLKPQLISFITHFLETQPVYVLDTSESTQAQIAKITEEIKVTPGRLTLKFK